MPSREERSGSFRIIPASSEVALERSSPRLPPQMAQVTWKGCTYLVFEIDLESRSVQIWP
jgi:hypothetical protein